MQTYVFSRLSQQTYFSQSVVEDIGKEFINALKPYQPNEGKIIFFFEGHDLEKPGRPGKVKTAARSTKLNQAVRGVYFTQDKRGGPSWHQSRMLLARNMPRPNWWFTVRLSDYIRGTNLLTLY